MTVANATSTKSALFCWLFLYSAILLSRTFSLRSHVILNERLAFNSIFFISTEVMYLQRCLVVT